VKQQLSRTELTIAFQQELERLGCNPGPADGDWGKKGRAALTKFNVYAKLKLPTDAPTMDALEAVKGNKERVCPLVCGPQFNIEGDQCVKKTCSSGQTLSSKGQCVKVAVNKLENQSQIPKKSGNIHCESNEFCCGRFKRGTVCTECCPI